MAAVNYSVTNILQNILFCVQKDKESQNRFGTSVWRVNYELSLYNSLWCAKTNKKHYFPFQTNSAANSVHLERPNLSIPLTFNVPDIAVVCGCVKSCAPPSPWPPGSAWRHADAKNTHLPAYIVCLTPLTLRPTLHLSSSRLSSPLHPRRHGKYHTVTLATCVQHSSSIQRSACIPKHRSHEGRDETAQ